MSAEILRAARPEDRAAVVALLTDAGLPPAGLDDHFPDGFVVACDADGTLLGAAGLEDYGPVGLLRSVAVLGDRRGTGLGSRLSRAVMAMAADRGVRELFLLTTGAEGYFPRLGFERVERDALPAALTASAQLRGACPVTAVAMRAQL